MSGFFLSCHRLGSYMGKWLRTWVYGLLTGVCGFLQGYIVS